MNVHFTPSVLCGTVSVPPSKSMAHRLLLCAALAKGTSVLHRVELCDDVGATLACLQALGVQTILKGTDLTVIGKGVESLQAGDPLPCGESGSTLRFLLPLGLLLGKPVAFTGSRTLFSRPLSVYEEICRTRGFTLEKSETGVRVCGNLSAGIYTVPGNISSQFISGLLFALATQTQESEIRITDGIESRPYIEMTRQALRTFGICTVWQDAATLRIPGNQTFAPSEASVEGDWSNAAYIAALGEIPGNCVHTVGLFDTSVQGDRVFPALFARLKTEKMPEIPVSDCPDLAPILLALGALQGGVILTGTRRLRWKESDRAGTMAKELEKCGADVCVTENTVTLTVPPSGLHTPSVCLDGHNDHRTVMALCLLLTHLGGTLNGVQAVTKSYPAYLSDLAKLQAHFVLE